MFGDFVKELLVDWVVSYVSQGFCFGIDLWFYIIVEVCKLKVVLEVKGGVLVLFFENLLDVIWSDCFVELLGCVIIQKYQYFGIFVCDKIVMIVEGVKVCGVDVVLIVDFFFVVWVFNICGLDVLYILYLFVCVIIYVDGFVEIFLDVCKIGIEEKVYLIQICEICEFVDFVEVFIVFG